MCGGGVGCGEYGVWGCGGGGSLASTNFYFLI